VKLLSVPEVADQLGRSEDFVRRLCQRRLIGHIKDGGRLFFDQDDVDDYIRQRRVEPIRPQPLALDRIRRRQGRAAS
jgi:excisionase family DNA binding protein